MINIQKVVSVDFDVVKTVASVGSYKKVLYIGNDNDADVIKIYENCGGVNGASNVIVKAASEFNLTTISDEKQKVSGTDNDFIFVCFSNAISAALSANNLQAMCEFNASHKVIPCLSLTISQYSTVIGGSDQPDRYTKYPVAIKLIEDDDTRPLALSIPAYYSNIQLDYAQSLRDYSYTEEPSDYEVAVQDSLFDTYVKSVNFVSKIGNKYVNFGGNLGNGVAITAQFGAIAAENDITWAVLNTILAKQYLTNEGLNNVIASINSCLTRYTYNGLLEQNSVYTGDTYVSTTNPPITLIKKGARLPQGYYVARIPMSRLTPAERAARKFTPIYVFMQTQSGARVVEIKGTIIDN